jgi:hypothetical protein
MLVIFSLLPFYIYPSFLPSLRVALFFFRRFKPILGPSLLLICVGRAEGSRFKITRVRRDIVLVPRDGQINTSL